MKSIPLILLIATIAAVQSVSAQVGSGPPPNTGGGSAADDAVSGISSIKRPSSSAPKTTTTTAMPKTPLDAVLCTDDKGKDVMTAFPASTAKIYLHYTDGVAAKGAKLKVVWIAEDAKGISTKNKKLTDTTSVLPGPGSVGNFYLPAAATGFPVGKYRAELYEDGKLAKTLKFTIKG